MQLNAESGCLQDAAAPRDRIEGQWGELLLSLVAFHIPWLFKKIAAEVSSGMCFFHGVAVRA